MATATVSISPDDLPDATLSFNDETGVYTLTVTGLTELRQSPRAPTISEKARGILASNPPTVQTKDKRDLDALILQAVEIAAPDGLLDNVANPDTGLPVDKEQLLQAQLTRMVRRALIALEFG